MYLEVFGGCWGVNVIKEAEELNSSKSCYLFIEVFNGSVVFSLGNNGIPKRDS